MTPSPKTRTIRRVLFGDRIVMGSVSRARVAGLALLSGLVLALALAVAYLGVLWHLARGDGGSDRRVPFTEPPDRPAPTLGRVPLFRVGRVGERFDIVDDAGRVVVLRGMHVVSLRPPFRPIPLGDEGPFRQWRSFGFNAVRLAVPWEALEPTPRGLNLDHIAYVKWFLDAAHRHGIAVVVDNPLSGISRCLGGVGAPAWAHRPGLIPDEAAASDCAQTDDPWWPEWPRRLRWWADFHDGAWTPDDLALQDHLIRVFVKLAEVVQNHPALVGYGLIQGASCERKGFASWLYPGEAPCEAALADFLRRFARAIRAVDADALVFFEEPVGWDGAGSSDVEIGPPPVEGLVWSVPAGRIAPPGTRGDCRLLPDLQALSRRASERYRAAFVLSEVSVPEPGAPSGDAFLHGLVDLEDARVSAFFSATGAPRCPAGSLIRPSPLRVGGVPIAWGLDRSFAGPDGGPADTHHDGRPVENTDAFTLVFLQTPVFADTWVFIPRRAFYGEDPATEAPEFTVDGSDGRWRWSEWDDQVLVWTPDPNRDEHRLVVKPWGGRRASGLGVGGCTEGN